MRLGSLQTKVNEWIVSAFGQKVADDTVMRNHRFLEESLELVQALGCSKDEAHKLVDYVYGRPDGEANQEVGGVLMTLMALCNAQGIEAELATERELARVWEKIDRIRAKQAENPRRQAERFLRLLDEAAKTKQ